MTDQQPDMIETRETSGTASMPPSYDDYVDHEAVQAQLLPQWRYAPDAWRWVRRLNGTRASRLLRLRSAKAIPRSMQARFLAMGIPGEALAPTLGAIRSTDQWADSWIETAQRYLGDYRRQVSSRNLLEAAQDKRIAALCYHAAQVFTAENDRTSRMCRAATATLFAQAQPYLYPDARQVLVPWRNAFLPAYLQVPASDQPVGLVVLINGATTAKEETFGWSQAFINSGLAVLNLDTPGTGEATSLMVEPGDDNDVIDGIFELFAHDRDIDLSQVSLVGISLGGNLAIRCAAYDRRIMAVATITPVYEPSRWLHRASPILLDQLGLFYASQGQDETSFMDKLSLYDVTPEVRCPLLVFGAARDMLIPPSESELLANRAGNKATLVWYPEGGHCLYPEVSLWTTETAIWINSIAAGRTLELQAGGAAETETVAALAREELLSTDVRTLMPLDDLDSSARLLEDDEYDLLGSSARLIDAPSEELDEEDQGSDRQ